jgi:hypothetical protein
LLQFRGSAITSDAGFLPYREADDAVDLTDTVPNKLADARTGKNGRYPLAGLLRQSLLGWLAGYDDVNDADRLCRDSVKRWVVGDRAATPSNHRSRRARRVGVWRGSGGDRNQSTELVGAVRSSIPRHDT